jgi:hypothetical protein
MGIDVIDSQAVDRLWRTIREVRSAPVRVSGIESEELINFRNDEDRAELVNSYGYQ